jgi:pyruvate dehydrogenase E1 component alpha subunit
MPWLLQIGGRGEVQADSPNGVGARTEEDDAARYIIGAHRGYGHAIAKGHEPKRMLAELFSKSAGQSEGRGASMHMADIDHTTLGPRFRAGSTPIGRGCPNE